jgi:hypothetical protein
VRTGKGCHTILLVHGNNVLISLLGTRTLGYLQGLVLSLELVIQRAALRAGYGQVDGEKLAKISVRALGSATKRTPQ